MGEEHAIRYIRALIGLSRRAATGVLEVACDERKARLSFDRGRLVYAEHKSLGATLGAHLVSRGVLGREAYQAIAERVLDRTGGSPMLSFVEEAVAAGMLDVDQASSILEGQVERNFIQVFTWDRMECSFASQERASEQGPRFECELEPLVMQGIRARFDARSVREHLAPRAQQYPKLLGASAADLVRTFRLQPAESRAARAVDGDRTVDALFDASHLDATATAHVLLALKLFQHIEWIEAPGEAGALADSSPAHAVPLAAIKLSARMVTPQSIRLVLPPPPSSAAIEAAGAFRRGVAAYRSADLHEARAQLARATESVRHPEHVLYLEWVEHELAAGSIDPAALSRLADAVRRALESDATLAFAYYVVGRLHLLQNDTLNAELAFRRAAKLDPTDERAEAEAERLRAARQGRPV